MIPSLYTKQFQNTATYWSVTNYMKVKVNMEHLYALEETVHATNYEIILFPTRGEIVKSKCSPGDITM